MPKLHITSIKEGYSRVKDKEKCKSIEWLLADGVQQVGVVAKSNVGEWTEWRVHYVRPAFPVTKRADFYNNNPMYQPAALLPNTEQTYLLMNCFTDRKEAVEYAKKHFATPEALKQELFNVYLKMLHPLG